MEEMGEGGTSVCAFLDVLRSCVIRMVGLLMETGIIIVEDTHPVHFKVGRRQSQAGSTTPTEVMMRPFGLYGKEAKWSMVCGQG